MARKFPDSSAQWGTDFPSVPTPIDLWTFQETASPLDDKIGALDLAQNVALVYGVTGDPTGRTAVGYSTVASNQFLGTGETSFGNLPTGTAFSLWIRTRMPDNATSVRSVVGKGVASPRWVVRFLNGGRFEWFLENAGGNFRPSPALTYDDGLYHDILLVYNPAENTNGQVHVYTELEHVVVALTNFGWVSQNGVTNASEFRVGASGGSTQLGNASQALASQVSYMAVWNVAISAAQWAMLIASDQAGTLDISGAAAVALDGISDSPGTLEISAAAALAVDGVADSPGALEIAAQCTVELDAVTAYLGTLDIAATGGVELDGVVSLLGEFSVEAAAAVALAGVLGQNTELHILSVLTFDESPGLGFFAVQATAGVVFSEVDYRPISGGPIAAAIKKLKTGDYLVKRALLGTVDEEGNYDKQQPGYFLMEASIQPKQARTLQPNPEGKHATEKIIIYTTVEIHTITPTHEPDVITYNGELYEVGEVKVWEALGFTHYEAVASRLVLP